MEDKVAFKDWVFRYQYIYRSRLTKSKKKKFIKALATDILPIREDIQVIEYRQTKKVSSHNIYIGDVEKADKIICTYYDTPPAHFGSYSLFNSKKQEKRTIYFMIISSFLTLLLGFIGILTYINIESSNFSFFSFRTFILVLILLGYFSILGKVTKGGIGQKTLIRNTSSVLTLLEMLKQFDGKNVAYAFVDDGCYGQSGLNVLTNSIKKSAKVFYLDSVGSDNPLYFSGDNFNQEKLKAFEIEKDNSLNISHNKVNYLFSAEKKKSNDEVTYQLTKKDLNKTKVNMNNIDNVIKLLK